jgi:hypothetical protein
VSFLGSAGSGRRVGAALLRHRIIPATAGTAAAVIVAGCAFASTHSSGQENVANTGNTHVSQASSTRPQAAQATPLRLLSVSPAGGTKHVNGAAPVTLRFSSALSPSSPLPKLSPKTAGSWKIDGQTATFTPSAGFAPDTKVSLTVPGGSTGMTAASAGTLQQTTTHTFTTGSYSTLRLQQMLTQLGYLPLTWTATGSGAAAAADLSGTGKTPSLSEEVLAAYDPPAGKFKFKPGYPAELASMWKDGKDNLLDQGAIRAFENNQGLTMDGQAGPQVWARLLVAAAKDKVNPDGYTYAIASQDSPNESLQVWHNGKKILDSPANTGIAAANTQDGTFPVYERLQFQVMKGTNPDGSTYADPVYWISYFNGGDAVHYFDRPGYGYYQSLGCVELPYTQAKFIWSYLTYGTLVTVTGPVA